MASNRKRGGNNKTDPAVKIAELAGGLSLTALRDNIPMLLKKAEAEAMSYSDFALQMLNLEFIARHNRRLTRNLKRSGLPNIIEGLDTYDF